MSVVIRPKLRPFVASEKNKNEYINNLIAKDIAKKSLNALKNSEL